MDWAVFTETIERLDTVSDADFASELAGLQNTDPTLADAVKRFQTRSANASSFMQTRMPGLPEDASPLLAQGDRVGVWQIDDRLGAGGMGEVYRASRADGLFDQQAALKIAKSKTKAFSDRFEAERQRLANLEHPNIARIIDGGAARDGAPYLTMEFVDGVPIDAFAKSKDLTRSQRLTLVGDLCAALAHAHGRLVLHRDIKPDNVLINKDGELRLIDFGVASLLDDPKEEAAPGPLTIGIASPEQLMGQPVSAATDIFAVAVLAHWLETGALPKRQSDGGVEIDRQAIGDEDLSAILAKATAFDPANRYASADALGDDVRRFLDGFPVTARPVSSLTRFGKLVARNKLASAMCAAAITAVIAGAIGISVFAIRADEEAEANRIAQRKGANTVELYETYNLGFNGFVASLDPKTERGQAIFKGFEELEATAQSLETSEPQKALQIYVFLAEVYADIGRDEDASRLGGKLADGRFEMTYPLAFTLSGLMHLSYGYIDTDKLTQTLDRLHQFYLTNPVIHSFDIAFNRCVRGRITNREEDTRACVDRASAHLEGIDQENYAEMAGNLPLMGYAIESAVELKELDEAKRMSREALRFYENEDRPGAMPQALFWLGLSDIAQVEEDWNGSKEHLLAGRRSLEGQTQFGWLEVALSTELADTQSNLAEFGDAAETARGAAARAAEYYGADHFQVREARAHMAVALAGQGDTATATRLLKAIVEAESSGEDDPRALEKYREMLAKITAAQP